MNEQQLYILSLQAPSWRVAGLLYIIRSIGRTYKHGTEASRFHESQEFHLTKNFSRKNTASMSFLSETVTQIMLFSNQYINTVSIH
jgi:hypothetical protein